MDWLALLPLAAFGLMAGCLLALIILTRRFKVTGLSSASGPASNPWRRWLVVGLAVIAFFSLSLMLCIYPARAVWNEYVAQRWPVVRATIQSSRVLLTHRPAMGKNASWTGWCVSWGYAYDWQDARYVGTLNDNSPGTFASGCFVYREAAERVAARRAPGSLVPVRVDPAQPSVSTANPPGIRGVDVAQLLVGVVPLMLGVYFFVAGVRAGRVGIPGRL